MNPRSTTHVAKTASKPQPKAPGTYTPKVKLNSRNPEAIRATALAEKLARESGIGIPPLLSSKRWKEIWYGVIETKPLSDWQRCDIPLIHAYIGAVLDVRDIEKAVGKLGILPETDADQARVNRLLTMMTKRLNHMATLHTKLGLRQDRMLPSSVTGYKGQENRHAKAQALLDDAEGDDLIKGMS